MSRLLNTRLLIGIAVSLFTLTANAEIIRYTLDSVTFEDGGTATGYFDWDTSLPDLTGEYQGASVNYDISVNGGGVSFPPYNYLSGISGPMGTGGTVGGNRILEVGDLFGATQRSISLIPDASLGTVGVDLDIPLLISPGNTFEAINVSGLEFRGITGGSLRGVVIQQDAATPVPTSPMWLLALLAGMLGTLAARQLRRSGLA